MASHKIQNVILKEDTDSESSSKASLTRKCHFMSGRAMHHEIPGLSYKDEATWTGPFWFIQAADTQLGMIDSFHNKQKQPNCNAESELCRRLVEIANNARPKPRFLIVCGDLVDAWPKQLRNSQVQQFKLIFSALHPDIKMICLAGNHDVYDSPTPADIADYRADFGDDYFTFWISGVKFIVINSQFLISDVNVRDHRRKQDEWLDKELRPSTDKQWKHLIGFQHIPPFLLTVDEPPVLVPQMDLPFNFPNRDQRQAYLARLKKAGMSHLFCGHYHRNAGGKDDDLEVVVTTAVGCQLGSDKSGFRVVVVGQRGIRHEFHEIQPQAQLLTIDLEQ